MCTSQSEVEELRAIRQELADVKRMLKKKEEEDTSYWATHQPDSGCIYGHNSFSPI